MQAGQSYVQTQMSWFTGSLFQRHFQVDPIYGVHLPSQHPASSAAPNYQAPGRHCLDTKQSDLS